MADDDKKQHAVDADAVAAKVLESLKKDSGETVSAQLIRENVIAREKRREAEEALAAAKAKLPAEGAVILTGDDAKSWETVKALGLKGDDVKKRLEERDTLLAKDEQRTRADARSKAARTAGYDPDALGKIAGVDALTFETKEEAVDGKKVNVAYVTPPGEKQTAVKLDEWLKTNVPAPIVTALKAADGSGTTAYPDQSGAEQPPAGKAYDPVAAGKEMAKTQKADTSKSLAFQ